MFKVLVIACAIMPYPRGEILETECYVVVDQWQPSIHGYKTEDQCKDRLKIITNSITKNFKLLSLKKQYCIKSQERERI
jgi:hypothetical protein|tara:strand:- start:180 stop:416 length:237 start_codon:yes stop_codon:yes gene_type:complete